MIKEYIKNNKLIIEIDLKEKRYCPFTETYKGEYTCIAGMVDERAGRYGLCNVIDMSYKGKDDQYSTIFYDFDDEQELEEFCRKHKLDLVYY